MHFVYIVRCADGTLYTGYAKNPQARVDAHNAGRGAKYTAGRRPVRLVHQEAFRSAGRALAREYAIKQLTRADKHRLIASSSRATQAGRDANRTARVRAAAGRVSSPASRSATRRHPPGRASAN